MQKIFFLQDEDGPKFTRGTRLAMILGLSAATWLGIIGVIAELS